MNTKHTRNTKMEANNSLENKVKTLQRQFGGMAKLVKSGAEGFAKGKP
jgi:hypothetical protein